MDNLENTLNLVGLRGYDAKVYSILLDFRDIGQEPVTAYAIARHCKPQMHVTTVYDSLNRLTDNGYVSFITEGRGKKYQLNGGVRQLISQLEDRKKSIDDLLPRLKKHPRSEINRAKIYQGFDNIIDLTYSLLEDNQSGEIISFGGRGRFGPSSIMSKSHAWHLKRIDKNISYRVLHTRAEGVEERVKRGNSFPLTEARYVPFDYTGYKSTTICDNITMYIVLGDIPQAVVMESEEVAAGNRQVFEFLWDMSPKIKRGPGKLPKLD